MKTYKTNKIKYFLFATIFSVIILIGIIVIIELIFNPDVYDLTGFAMVLLPWGIIVIALILDAFHQIEINSKEICRNTILGKNVIEWNDILVIKYVSLNNKITLIGENNKRIALQKLYVKNEDLYREIYSYLMLHNKYNLIPSQLKKYINKIT